MCHECDKSIYESVTIKPTTFFNVYSQILQLGYLYLIKSLKKPSMEGKGLPMSCLELRTDWKLVAAEEGGVIFLCGKWQLVCCPCHSGWLHVHDHVV